MLYNLFIQPLVIILRAIYLGINHFAGNLGFSLMILSVIMSILLRPFILWASRIQDKERRIQNILAPQIAEIKQNFHGAEQHEELSALYKRYSYNPIYAIRSGLELFVQLLPLMAAYMMLSELEILKGTSFYVIKDLSRPDGLLAGFNLLPFVMTGLNVLAALTAKKFTKRERIQAFIIAGLFLIMLYNAPSALLIYWTTNNFIMLLKNIDLSGVFGGEKISGFMSYRFEPTEKKAICLNIFAGTILLTAVIAFTLYIYFSYGHLKFTDLNSIKTLHDIYIFAFAPSFILAFIGLMKFLSGSFSMKEGITKTLYFVVGTLIVLLYIKFVMFPQAYFHKSKLFTLVIICYTIMAFILPVSDKKIHSYTSPLSGGFQNSLFFSSIVFAIIFVCVLYPSLLYRSDPDFFLDSLSGTISSISIYGTTLLFILILLWPLLPEIMQNFLAFAAAFLVCMAFINSFVLTENYGNINALQLDNRMMTMGRSLTRDFISLVMTSLIMITCVRRKYIRHLVTAFVLISFAMCGASIYCYFNIKHVDESQAADNTSEFPEYHNRLWRFSRTGKNVVCLFLDGFTGEHVIKIFAENPELVDAFDGFTYYPDTLATGPRTFFSTPSIYAGSAYKPNTLNDTKPNMTITEKYGEAASFLPNIFSSKGYDSVIASVPYLDEYNNFYTDKVKYPEQILTLYGDKWQDDYIPYWVIWADKNGIKVVNQDKKDISQFLMTLSLFRAIPFSLRGSIYNFGNWIGGTSEEVTEMMLAKYFVGNLAPIQFMGDFIQTDDGKPVFKFIHSMLSHSFWYLTPDSLQPVLDPYPATEGQSTLVDGIIPEHYYTEVHIMRFLADFITKLKNAGVYDNTRIVFVSDHGWCDSATLNKNFHNNTFLETFRPNALLMFKDFDSHGDLITSNALMSIEDTPALLIAGIDIAQGIPTPEELKALSSTDRIRTYCENYPDTDDLTLKLFGIEKLWQINGSLFNPANWTRLQ